MKTVISLDVGGTKTLGALINSRGDKLREFKTATNPQQGRDGLIESLEKVIDTLLTDSSAEAIAIGSAGRINFETGAVYYATNNLPDWTDFKLKEYFEKKYNLPVIVDNDVNVAGLGEEWLGNAQNVSSYVCITLGTGIAAAIKLGNTFIRGHHWSAGEVGHMLLHPEGRQCNCGLKGCFEQYCSGTALFKIYNELSKNSSINSGRDFFELIKKRDMVALSVLNGFKQNLANALVSLANVYDPEVFILGGGLIETKEYWWDDLIKLIENSALAKNVFTPVVIPAKLGNDAGIYGAAFLAFKYLKEK